MKLFLALKSNYSGLLLEYVIKHVFLQYSDFFADFASFL